MTTTMETWKEKNQETIRRALRIIKALPFTRAVMLTGSLAEGRASEQSDIDFFVQIEPGRLWSSRLLVTLVLQLAGIRRTDRDIPGKVCLNWFATFNAPEKQKGRIYKVLWEDERYRLNLSKANSNKETLRLPASPAGGRSGNNLKPIFEKVLTIFFLWWGEKLLKKVQIARILRDKRTKQPGGAVRYSDTELGFHPKKDVKST